MSVRVPAQASLWPRERCRGSGHLPLLSHRYCLPSRFAKVDSRTNPPTYPSSLLSAVLLVGLKPRNISKKYSGLFEGFHDSFCWEFSKLPHRSFLWSPFRARGHSASWSRPSAWYINRKNLSLCDRTNVFIIIPVSSVREYVGSKKLFGSWPEFESQSRDSLFVLFCDLSLSHCPKFL